MRAKSANPSDRGLLTFQCNVCGAGCRAHMAEVSREQPSCHACGSTVRMRAMIDALSRALLGASLPLPEIPERPDIVGLGMSDWEGYAAPLAKKLSYTNTFYHKPPFLNITSPDHSRDGTLDFLLSSDVFEHVAPPIARAFENARRLLKPTGALVFSVPYKLDGETDEHFPELHEWHIELVDGKRRLINITRDGRHQEFQDLVFHGGEGDTLEMRVFSEQGLIRDLQTAGFSEVTFLREDNFDFGIYWQHKWSLPLIARANNSSVPLVVDWGPRAARTGSAFNLQPNGDSALWFRFASPVQSGTTVRLAGTALPTVIAESRGCVTASLDETVRQKLINASGRYEVEIFCGPAPTSITVGCLVIS